MDERLVNYFIEETNKKFDRLETKIDMLLQFKWQIIGGSVAFSAFITLAIQGISMMINKN